MKRMMAVSAVLAVALSACGGGGGRPSTDEIADALKSEDSAFSALTGDATDAVVDCMAKALHDSDLSDEALQALVEGDEDFEGDEDDEAAVMGMSEDLTACALEGAGG